MADASRAGRLRVVAREAEDGGCELIALPSDTPQHPTRPPGPTQSQVYRTVNDCFNAALELSPAYTSITPCSTTKRPRLS